MDIQSIKNEKLRDWLADESATGAILEFSSTNIHDSLVKIADSNGNLVVLFEEYNGEWKNLAMIDSASKEIFPLDSYECRVLLGIETNDTATLFGERAAEICEAVTRWAASNEASDAGGEDDFYGRPIDDRLLRETYWKGGLEDVFIVPGESFKPDGCKERRRVLSSYLSDPVASVSTAAKDYVSASAAVLLARKHYQSNLLSAYEEFVSSSDEAIVRQKEMLDAAKQLKEQGCKYVSLTLSNTSADAAVTCEFGALVRALIDRDVPCSWSLKSPSDRDLAKRALGDTWDNRNSDVRITEIKYRGKVLWSE